MTSLLIAALLAAPGCLEVSQSRITAGHLTPFVPRFASIPPDAEFGYAPAPGTTRWIRRGELESFARRHGIGLDNAPELCAVRPSQVLTAAAIENALRPVISELLPGLSHRIEVIDYIRLPLPQGVLTFRKEDLHEAQAGALLWRGRIIYDRNRSMPVWVKARIAVEGQAWFARRLIEKGRKLNDEDVELRKCEVPLLDALKRDVASTVVGLEALSSIEAGSRIPAGSLGRPLAVQAGDKMKVYSESGSVRFAIEADAVQAGRVGDLISIMNRSNGAKLRARVIAPGEGRITVEESRNETDRRGDRTHSHRRGG
ncbi:MAG: flagellar basal body P-ring formation protein FlgA [Bryobacteraceae bacterium]|nr:flagellar basal body P-ring formation protein FlgA [Bryobacteraceae bacterium]